MKAIGVKDVKNFDFLDRPKPNAVETALSNLKQMKALDDEV